MILHGCHLCFRRSSLHHLYMFYIYYIFLLIHIHHSFFLFFFFNDPAPTEIYTLSLHDALPISPSCSLKVVATETLSNTASTATPASTSRSRSGIPSFSYMLRSSGSTSSRDFGTACRSEEHTSELQSRSDLVCRLLLEKKNTRESVRGEGNRYNLSSVIANIIWPVSRAVTASLPRSAALHRLTHRPPIQATRPFFGCPA